MKGVIFLLLLFSGVTALTSWNQHRVGIARDEIVYMSYGSRYLGWWEQWKADRPGVSDPKTISDYWGGKAATDNNREHPPLMKVLFGLSKKVLHDQTELLDELPAYRFPNALLYGVLAVLVCIFVSSMFGGPAGLLAALLLVLMPRGLFHASLACFDAPIVTFWFATLMAYLLALRKKWGFVVLGIVFGLALATKHNAILIPVLLSVHWLWLIVSEKRRAPKQSLWAVIESFNPQLWVGVLILAPLVLVALWPWLWFDTFAHVSDWIGFHLHHVHYNFEYLGANLNAPPFAWHVPIVTTALVVPSVTIAACAGGLVLAWVSRKEAMATVQRSDKPLLLLFLSAGVAMGPFLLRTTPIFGAEKHWAAAMPSVAVFATFGVLVALRWGRHYLSQGVRDGSRFGWLGVLLSTAMVAVSGYETWVANPYALTHYVGLAGGAPGGAELGMNRQFWGYSARGVLPLLNAEAREGKSLSVYTHDASMAWSWYQRLRMVEETVVDSGPEDSGIRRSDLAFVVHEKHFNRHDYKIWESYRTTKPVFVLRQQGVPIITVYKRSDTKALK